MLTIKQIETIFWRQTMIALGFNPDEFKNITKKPDLFMPVRIAWHRQGAPAWKDHEDVTFILVTTPDDPINRPRHVTYQNKDAETAIKIVERTRVIRINWVLYGPNSLDNANLIRDGLFESFKEPLQHNNMFLIPDVPEPRRAPELFSGHWWERADFSASFNEYIKSESEVGYLKTAKIQLKREDGESKNVIVEC